MLRLITKRENIMIRKTTASMIIVLATASFSPAAAGVDVYTPDVRVQVGTPQSPPLPHVRVIERERVIVREHEYEGKKDNGKHKGHYKKHKKEKKNDH
jgi:hypothetical protein